MSLLSKLEAVLTDMTPQTEVEVTFTVTEARFDHIMKQLQEGEWALMHAVTLDLNYNQENSTYRVTVEKDVNAVFQKWSKAKASTAFQELIKTYPTIQKTRKHTHTIDDFKLKVSDEVPIKAALKITDKVNVLARKKDRVTQVVYKEKGFIIKVEATEVQSGNHLGELDDTSYEIDVELSSTKNVATIPKPVLEAYADALQRVKDMVDVEMDSSESSASVSGREWVKDNRIGFLSWIYKTFAEKEVAVKPVDDPGEDNFCTKAPGNTKTQLFPHQKFVKEYLQFESPYRGLMLYHGLGVGKTCASIAAAEGFIAHNKKVVVLLPASLATNYRDEITRCASVGNPESKVWSLVNGANNKEIFNDFFVSEAFAKKSKYKVWLPFVPDTYEEYVTKNEVKWSEMSAAEQEAASATLNNIIDNKYEFISYNGLVQKTVMSMPNSKFNDCFVVIDEAHNFISRVANKKKIASIVYEKLMEAKGMKIVLLSGTPIINHPYELALSLNLVRGKMIQYEVMMAKGAKVTDVDVLRDALREKGLQKYIDTIDLDVVNKKVIFTLQPPDFVATISGSVVYDPWTKSTNAVKDSIVEALQKKGVGKQVKEVLHLAYPNDDKEFENVFLDMTDRDNPTIRNMDMFTRRAIGLVSYFKTAGEEYFPKLLPKVIYRIPLADYQFIQYVKKREEERKMESRNKGGLLADKTSVYRAFSRMACNFVFPEKIKRPFPKDLRKAAQREIDAAMEEDDVDAPVKKVKAKDIDAEYEAQLSKIMKTLATEADTVLSPEALQNLYSPKMEAVYKKVATSPGKILLYSQFRTIEGLGIIKLILDSRGYKEVRLTQSKAKGGYVIVNATEVLKPEYDGKRYMTFDTERDKSAVLLQMFNNDPNCPADLKRPNLRGEFIKMIMVTQSGAEGINLKNVRQVIILEPFWNMVRIDQVIGRAVRTCSHHSLPPEERNVEVTIFCSDFTEKQLKDNPTLRILDKKQTSDMHIMQTAERKDVMIQTFLNHLKTAAVDCRSNATANGTLASGLQCFAFPMESNPDESSYKMNIDHDRQQGRLHRRRKIRGKAVTHQGKKYVVVDDYPDKLFDYVAYKDAGVLEEA